MGASTRMIHVRIEDELRTQASVTLEAMGLSVSEAVRLFLHRVVTDQALPFDLKVPNAKTRAAMKEADQLTRTRRARFASGDELVDDLEKNSRR